MFNYMFFYRWSPVSSWPCHWQRTLNMNRNIITVLFKTTWAATAERNLLIPWPNFASFCPFSLLNKDFKAKMKIPFLSNVYSAFSHIRSHSVCSFPPLIHHIPGCSGSEPAIDCRWKARKKGEDGNEAEGRDKKSPQGLRCLAGLVSLSDHAGPHVHSSPWSRCVRGCSGSAMGRGHVWADIGFLPNYRCYLWSWGSVNKNRISNKDHKLLKWSESDWNLSHSDAYVPRSNSTDTNTLYEKSVDQIVFFFSYNLIRTHPDLFKRCQPDSFCCEWQASPCYVIHVCSSASAQQFTTLKGPMANLQTIVPCNTIWALLIKCRCGSSQCEFVTH